jgi:hypothetical protein
LSKIQFVECAIVERPFMAQSGPSTDQRCRLSANRRSALAVVKDGRTNFSELQSALAARRQRALTFLAFDFLSLEGFDLRDAPLSNASAS